MFSMFSPSSLRGWPLLLLSSTLIFSSGLLAVALAPSIAMISLGGALPGMTIRRVAIAPAQAQARPGNRLGSRISYGLLFPLLAIGGLRRRLRAMPRSLLPAASGMLSLGALAAASRAAASAAVHYSTTVTLTIREKESR